MFILTTRHAWIGEFNVLRTTPVIRLVGTMFDQSNKDPNFWVETTAAAGSVSQSSGAVTLTTGTSADGYAQYRTVRFARWVPGQENHFRTIVKMRDTGTANNVRSWGQFTTTDGVFFQLSGTTLSIVTRKGSVDAPVAKASWNRDTSFVLDTNYHIYEILTSWANINFYIDHRLVHVVDIVGSSTNPMGTLTLPAVLRNANSGGSTSNLSLTALVCFVSRIGVLETDSKYFNVVGAQTTLLKYGAGRLHSVIINKTAGTSVILYDNIAAAGGIIGSLTTTNQVALTYNCPFFFGLTIVATGAVDVTIVYE